MISVKRRLQTIVFTMQMGKSEEQLTSTDCWPTVGRQTADSWPTVGRQTANCRPTSFSTVVTICQPTVGRLLVICR